jgi:hypothetical protein
VVTTTAITISGQYSLTVNKDRLINAANEPHWLLLNGDYRSTMKEQLISQGWPSRPRPRRRRYSKDTVSERYNSFT